MNKGLNSAMIALTGVVGIATVALGIAAATTNETERVQGGLLVVAGLLRAPAAIALTFVEAALRSGGTVHVVARKPAA